MGNRINVKPGSIALVGSGEYLPVMLEVERELLVGRPSKYVQIPLAAGLESDESLDYWVKLGQEQAERLGVEAISIRVRNQDDANDPTHALLVRGAGLIYLSGGNPSHLAKSLNGTTLWKAIVDEWKNGAVLAGCSAGAMALTGWVPALRRPFQEPTPGLGLLPHLRVLPHFDRMFARIPELLSRFSDVPEGVSILGIDEDTALVGGPHKWTVKGRQSVWLINGSHREEFHPGDDIETP
ncbi:cyanophycinase [mine drainage metagenome]|uniref:Cyanophycinase n=1 Tax=mine drainage metagenome TaxID=410659 RepID=A0A1J5PYY8_9ZZZZ